MLNSTKIVHHNKRLKYNQVGNGNNHKVEAVVLTKDPNLCLYPYTFSGKDHQEEESPQKSYLIHSLV